MHAASFDRFSRRGRGALLTLTGRGSVSERATAIVVAPGCAVALALACTPASPDPASVNPVASLSGTAANSSATTTSGATNVPVTSSHNNTATPASSATTSGTSGVPTFDRGETSDGADASGANLGSDSVSSESAISTALSGTSDIGASESQASTGTTTGASGETTDGEAHNCAVGFDGVRPPPLTLSGNTFAHDPTMIAIGGSYYRFWTGDFVPSAKSTDLKNWENAPSVYGREYPDWVADWRADHPGNTFNFPWAPDVAYFGGKYHLYASFSAFFGRNSSCITHLSTDDLNAPQWVDHGPVICSESGDDFNAIDADVGIDAEGNAWLAFGSFWDGIFAFALDQDGNRVGTDATRLAWAKEIEAPVLFYRCGYYYLFVSWGLCCPGEGRSVDDLSYRVVVGRSEHVLGPYVDRAGVPLIEGGGTLVVEGDRRTFAAAGHSDVLIDGERTYHVYHAYRQTDGGAELRVAELPFDAEGWPVGGTP